MSAPELLAHVASPGDLRLLPAHALPALAAQIRRRLIDVVTRTGGHLGPNLGVVELTIALHRAFEAPRDAIVWDTGHQSYVHKMLTGRNEELEHLRAADGIAGYPSRGESDCDIVENSHASTALSYADGLARGFQLTGRNRRVVAVIGDGALTGGMAWEALNNIGAGDRPVIVVLNDNGRSYDPTVGALAHHLSRLRERATESSVWQALGLGYVGPVDGHNFDALDKALACARRHQGPVLVHVVTRKGCGYPPAEHDPADRMHSISPAPGTVSATAGGTGSARTEAWTTVFGRELAAIGEERSDVVAVTAAMRLPTGLGPFGERFPHRLIDVGIAEQHAVTCAAGLATTGLHPVVAIYSTFLGRAFDQVLMDVGLHRLPVTFVLDRAGVTGPDGPSHHGMWDVTMLRGVPGVRIAAPRDAVRLRELLREALAHEAGPTVLRYPKGTAPAPTCVHARIGSVDLLTPHQPGAQVLVVPSGPLASVAVDAAQRLAGMGVSITVADPRWIHPLTPELMTLIADHQVVITTEDNAIGGGLGAAVSMATHRAGLPTRVIPMGLPVEFVPVGDRAQLLARYGLDADHLVEAVLQTRWRRGARAGAVSLASS